ncbi:MAG: sulfatase-like hydrolase/transferase, partial [Planctomycetaceae bacterium]|nr:sulfatase-like hydrolase/transferase [Planctomycetaceae bacterium]
MVTRLCSLLILAGLALPIHAAPSETPNVVLIMTDNHGAWTLGCYGNPDIATPHIDRLAAEGTMMTRAFASNPVCSPTRATYLTGLLPSQHGVHCFLRGGRLQIGPEARNTLAEFRSLPEILKEQGYRCGLVGKWHLGANLEPQEGLDDYWITMPHGGTSTFYDAPIIENGKQRTEPKYLTEFWTDHAVKFLEQDDERPFFLFLAYNGPYSLGRLLLREGQNRHVERYRSGVPSFPIEEPHPWQFNNLDYMNNPVSNARVATEVSGVDDGVGRVMDCLRAQGVGDNTLVVFVADQGWVGGHGGFYGMGDHTRPATARDGMLQVPMIWHHPGKISAGQESDLIVTNYDFLPTVLGYLGLSDQLGDSPKSPGRDFSSVLTGGDLPDWRNEAFAEFEYLRSIRTESHRLVRRFADGPDELYDITSDPGEERNLIDDPESQTVLEQLDKRLTNFFDEYASPKYDLWNSGDSQTVVHTEATKSLDPLPVRRETAADADDASHQLALGSQPSSLSSSDDDKSSLIRLPDGYTVERVAGPPLVEHPLMAGFDDQGRLYVAENAGMNLRFDDLEKQLPNSVKRLEDTDGDGIFDKATTFADKMTFPMGALWYRGSVYVASPPYVWKLTDTDDDGVADQREKFAGIFGSNGNAADVHGCFLSPDGRIYWCDGRHGHEFRDDDGNVTSQGKGSNIFTCWPDGSDLYAHCGGGMDNPVEVDFTDTGDVLGTVNILYRS